MKKLLYVLIFLGGFAVLFGVGRLWKLKPETKYDHVLKTGEVAVVAGKTGETVYLTRDQKDTYAANVAMTRRDSAWLEEAAARNAVFAVPAGAFVRVTAQKESRVRVEVVDGPAANQQGWAEFEYVRPKHRGEFR